MYADDLQAGFRNYYHQMISYCLHPLWKRNGHEQLLFHPQGHGYG